jgi:hypothetical protein
MVENLSKADRVRERAASIASRSRFKNPNSDYDRIKGELMARDLTTDIKWLSATIPKLQFQILAQRPVA